MSQETREFLREKYGMGSFAGIGYDLSQEDRTDAAAAWLDSLFDDFAKWLTKDPEPTTADEFNEYDGDKYAAAAEPQVAPRAETTQTSPRYRLDFVRVSRWADDETLVQWDRTVSPNIEVTIGQADGTVFFRRTYNGGADTTAFPASAVQVFTSEGQIG